MVYEKCEYCLNTKKYYEVKGILWKIKQIMQHVFKKNTVNFLVA